MRTGPLRGLVAAAALALAGCATAPAAPPPAAVQTAPAAAPAGMQWLYGSGEGAAASLQAYGALRDYVLAAARNRPARSVVLDPAATLDSPSFVPCDGKPPAIVLDVDETVLQNLGYEYDQAVKHRGYDQPSWERWEQTGADKVLPMPGAPEALSAIRGAGVAVIFITNRLARYAAFSEQALNGAGVGPARHGDTLFLQGDDSSGSAKDGRRAAVAQLYCVLAMVGDQLGDFSDLFNARGLGVSERRRAAASPPFAGKWGHGWFLLSNPVYGPSLKGGIEDVFPAERRWTDPQQGSH